MQEALLIALRRWPFHGVPDDPTAWLAQVARHRAVDALRRRRTESEVLGGRREDLDSPAARAAAGLAPPELAARFSAELDDDVLRMVFACCHPAIPTAARSALTLKLACGFGVGEIARAFLTTEITIQQRLVRAKARLRAIDAPLEVPGPDELPARLDSVLEVIYLLFNEGHVAHRGAHLVRDDLVEEAVRLATLVVAGERTARPEAHALLALMLLQGARLPARLDAEGRLLLLGEQDRARWRWPWIARGFEHFAASCAGERLSEYHVQAAIAACHAMAPTPEATDWSQILAHYDVLVRHFPSPVARLNRAVAVAMAEDPARGLAELEPLAAEPALADYSLYHATRGELLARSARPAEAAQAFLRAHDLAGSDPERRFLAERHAQMTARAQRSR